MDLLNLPHLQESARRAAGSFLSPLTNAIGEQRRLVDSLAVVSKVRVEECKHMMVWSKSQTEDIGDVLLKLNLLIRKISDYEIRFGTQYESFREKIKYLRTKDDSLCEMGRRQADMQQKILDASKSRLRSAKARILQTELDDFQKESAPTETKLQALKRQCIKGAYTEQLNAIIELGRKMQIIGEHGKDLLDHIDTPDSVQDGRKTEDILQSARIALENWDQLVMVNPQSVVVHPPPPPPRSQTGLSVSSINSVSTVTSLANLTISGSEVSNSSDSSDDSDVEYVAAPSTPLKAKASVAVTTSSGPEPKMKQKSSVKSKKSSSKAKASEPPVEEVVTAAAVIAEAESSSSSSSSSSEEEEEEEEEVEEEEEKKEVKEPEVVEAPKKDLLSPFGSTLAPKLTLTPTKLKPSPSRATIPTESDWASEATQALASIQIKKAEELQKQKDGEPSDAETLRRLEELEIKHALELSLAESQAAKEKETEAATADLDLTAEEIRFVMGDVVPKRSTRIPKRQARGPETVEGDSDAVITRRLARMSKRVSVNTSKSASASHTETEDSEEDLETPKATQPPRVRGPQLTVEPEGPRISQQGPRPWIPEEEEQQQEGAGAQDESSSSDNESDVHEELASSSAVGETMGEQHSAKPKKARSIVRESLGREPERPLESMGPEPEKPLESMGPEPEVTLESMGNDGPQEEPVNFVPMPQMPSMDAIRQQKLQQKQQLQQQQQYQQQQQQQQQQQYQQQQQQQYQQQQQQQIYNSPQPMNQQVQSPGTPQSSNASLYAPSPSTANAQLSGYQSPSYRPATTYVPSPKQKNRLSGSHNTSPSASPQMQNQQQQQQYQQSGTYTAQYQQQLQQQQHQYYKQQQQQLQDFYYSSYEQEYQQQQYQQYQQQLRHQRVDSVSSVSSTNSTQSSIAPLGWSLPGMAAPQVTEDDIRRYKEQHQQQQQYQQQQQQHQQQQQQYPGHERRGSAAGSAYNGEDNVSSGAPSPSPSHISLIPDHSASPVMVPSVSVAPLTVPKKTSSSHLAPNPDDYKVEVKET